METKNEFMGQVLNADSELFTEDFLCWVFDNVKLGNKYLIHISEINEGGEKDGS